MWLIRDIIVTAVEAYGHDFKFDFSVDPKFMNEIASESRRRGEKYGVVILLLYYLSFINNFHIIYNF
jgi:hypothetical protein